MSGRTLPNVHETDVEDTDELIPASQIWYVGRDEMPARYGSTDEQIIWDRDQYLHSDRRYSYLPVDNVQSFEESGAHTPYNAGSDFAWYTKNSSEVSSDSFEHSNDSDIRTMYPPHLSNDADFYSTSVTQHGTILQSENYSTTTEKPQSHAFRSSHYNIKRSKCMYDNQSLNSKNNSSTKDDEQCSTFYTDESSDFHETSCDNNDNSPSRRRYLSVNYTSFDADDEDEKFDGNNNEGNEDDVRGKVDTKIDMGDTEPGTLTADGKKDKKEPCLCCPPGICRFIGQTAYNFFTGPPDSYVPLKTVLGFPFGLVLACGLYYALIQPMDLKGDTRTFVVGALVLGVSCGYALSVQVRCIIIMLIPTFFGKEGRAYIGAIAIGYLVAGPVHNIVTNGKEVTRSLACAAELSSNHTAAKWKLKLKPLEDVMSSFQSEGMYMKKVVKRVDAAFQPFKKEVRDMEDIEVTAKKTQEVDRLSGNKRGNRLEEIRSKSKFKKTDTREQKAEKKFKGKMSLQCENVWNEAVLKCRSMFGDLERRCNDAIPFINFLLCLPFKLTFFCELVRLVKGSIGMDCNSANLVNPGFGETYVASEDMVNTMDSGFEVNLQYKLVNTKEELDYTSAEEIRKGTMHEFERRQKWMDFITTFLARLMGFTFLRVIYSSFKYNEKYLSDYKYDNIYITDYFKHVERRRRIQGKRGLIPLKKFERCGLTDPWSKKITKNEMKKLSKGTFLLIMRMLITGVIIYSDYLLYEVLDIIRRHSRIDYAQVGKHEVKVRVFGVGFMSNIVRTFISNFDSKHEIKEYSSNFECLPKPRRLEEKYIIYIYLLYGAVWFCMVFEAYGLRLRRLIASFFYRKREKARVLFLYNDLYKKRRGYIRHIRKEVRRKVRKNTLSKKTNLLATFRREFPKLLGWLKRFESGKEVCLICGDPEDKKFVRCKTFNCKFGYCKECWEDVHHTCYACTWAGSDDSVFSESDTDSSGVEEF